jgi:hypothetical protein
MLKRIREIPARQRYGVPALVLAAGLCGWATTERGLFDGLILLASLCGVLSLGILLVPSRPRLRVIVRDESDPTRLVLAPTFRVRPLGKEAIAQEQVDLALETMPARPEPKLGPDDSIGQMFSQSIAAGLQASWTGATDERLTEFENQVASYGGKLVRWLERLDAVRAERLKVFEGELRIEELGHAPADHVHLRLRFPTGFKLARKLPRSGEPPTRPDFSPGITLPPGLFNRELPEIEPIYLPGTDKARYSMEGEAPVIDWDLGRVNQLDHRDVPTFSLRAPGSGSYAIHWEASATGLGQPAHGELTIEFGEPQEGPPIRTLAEAETERERIEEI